MNHATVLSVYYVMIRLRMILLLLSGCLLDEDRVVFLTLDLAETFVYYTKQEQEEDFSASSSNMAAACGSKNYNKNDGFRACSPLQVVLDFSLPR